MPPAAPEVRRNGFQRPISPLQIVLIVVVSIDVAVFFSVYIPLVKELHFQILLGAGYAILVATMVAAGVHVAAVDPSHPQVHWKRKRELEDISDSKPQSDQKLPHCYSCTIRQDYRTEHCNFCNRCVSGFDHHCIWLNNCVGDANYISFWVAMSTAVVMLGSTAATGLGLLMECAIDQESIQARMTGRLPGMSKELMTTIASLLTIVNIPLMIVDLNLVLFHVGLVWTRHTTLEYIKAHNAYDRALENDYPPPASKDGTAFRPFPRCIDWVVFRPRSKKKRKAGAVAPLPPASKEMSSAVKVPAAAETVTVTGAKVVSSPGDVVTEGKSPSAVQPGVEPEAAKPMGLQEGQTEPAASSLESESPSAVQPGVEPEAAQPSELQEGQAEGTASSLAAAASAEDEAARQQPATQAAQPSPASLSAEGTTDGEQPLEPAPTLPDQPEVTTSMEVAVEA